MLKMMMIKKLKLNKLSSRYLRESYKQSNNNRMNCWLEILIKNLWVMINPSLAKPIQKQLAEHKKWIDWEKKRLRIESMIWWKTTNLSRKMMKSLRCQKWILINFSKRNKFSKATIMSAIVLPAISLNN